MALYKTGNPVPSSAMPDVWDNNRVQDEILNSEELEVETRTGIMTPTWKGVLKKNEDEIEETRQNLIPLSRQYMTLAAAQADIANIPLGSTTYYRSPDDSALAVEVINNAGTLQPTGRKMPSQGYIDSIIRKDDINSPAVSIATKDGFSVCSFYVNEDTGNIEMIVDKIPQVNADTVDFNGVTLARSESGMLLFEDKLGFQVELSDLIQQVSAGTAGATGVVLEYATLARAKNAVDIGTIPDGSTVWVADSGTTLTVEYVNNSGTLELTGRKSQSLDDIDKLIGNVSINSPVFSLSSEDGLSLISFYANENTGEIGMSVDKIYRVDTDELNIGEARMVASDGGLLVFQDENGVEVDIIDLVSQIAGESVVSTGDTAALLSADAAAYIAQNYNLKRHPVAVIRQGLNLWFVYGQSFTLGTAAKGILTRTDSALGNLMLGQSPRGSNLNPGIQNAFAPVGGENKYTLLRERRQKDDGTMTADDSTDSTTFGETILSGLLETLKDNHNRSKGVVNDASVTLAGSCCGTVGVSITALKKRTAADPANNVVGNPTFANSASGWSAGTVTPVDGVNVLYSGSSYVESAKFDVTAGAVIEVTGRVYFPTAITGTVRVNIRFDGPSLSNVAVAALAITNPAAGSVYPVSRRITVPAGATTGIYQIAKPTSVSTGISSPSAIPVTGDQLTDYYGRWLSCLKGHMEAAKTAGYEQTQVAGIIWMQGENDTGGMTTAEYLGHLNDIKSSMISDCIAATGQKEAPGFFVYQTGGMYAGNTQKLNVQMAQIGITDTDRGAFFLHNEFPYPRPANHWYANSYRWAGCQYAKEIYPVVSGLNFNPFKPLDAVYDGKAIYVSFSPLYAPLVKQPFYTGTTVTDHADYGFTVIDANGVHYGSAVAVEIASDTVMKITPTFTLTGAMTVVLGDANHAGGHNIADSDDQLALYQWTYETGYGLDAGENIAALVNRSYPLFNRSASYSISVRTL